MKQTNKLKKKPSKKVSSDKKKKKADGKRKSSQKKQGTSSKRKQIKQKNTAPIKKGKHKKRLRKGTKKRKRNIKRVLLDILIASGITIFLSVLLFNIFFQFANVNGYGMLPTLSDRDVLLVNKMQKNYRRFKLVYVQASGEKEKVVQRIVGLPGESVFYKEDHLYVNGQVVEEKFILNEIMYAKKAEDIYTEDFQLKDIDSKLFDNTIPKGKYLVLGDNRPFSSDSRFFGLVDEKDIVGIVKMRILPLHKMNGF